MRRRQNKTGRSSSDLSPFVAIERYLLNSPAWRDLSATARAAYIELASGYDGSNNGRIVLGSQTLGKHMGCNKTTAARALKELVDHGFADCVKKGGFVCKVRHASEWRLAAFKCHVTGDLPSKLFMRWQPKIQKPVALEAPSGGAGETVEAKNSQDEASRWRGRNREGFLEAAHGGASATLLYSSHRLANTHSLQSDGAGKLKAREQRDRVELNSFDEGLQSFCNIASKVFAQFSGDLPGDCTALSSTPSKPVPKL